MPEPDEAAASRWEDACRAVELLAVDRVGLGGIAVRAQAGPVRGLFLAVVGGHFDRVRRMPAAIGDEALLGGLDLAGTLQAGRPMMASGLLRAAEGGVIQAGMAERMAPGVVARLTAAMDGGADFAVVALDEGVEPEEGCGAALLDRLAFHLDLSSLSHRDAVAGPADASAIASARESLGGVRMGAEVVEALCGTALALGIGSARAGLLAVRVARAAAALAGREEAGLDDAVLATRLVLAPRATLLPAAPEQEEVPQEGDAPAEAASGTPPDAAGDGAEEQRLPTPDQASELLLQAAKAAIPAGLLARLDAQDHRLPAGGAGRQGARQASAQRGRPVGLRAAQPGPGLRLNLIETLRAAAPWQTLRPKTGRIALRRQDFRVTRAEQPSRTTTIFVVDASGSAALNRLAEAKGAVELLLADCYRRRDQVAVIAFRGTGAQLLLPPTRSLVRAKRSLAGLPGGGGTPLAAGLDAAFLLAETVRRGGASPTIVLLTDGRANVTRAGTGGREVAAAEALAAARRVRGAGMSALVLDTAPRPAADAASLASAMGALYVPLPYANAVSLAETVRRAGRPA